MMNLCFKNEEFCIKNEESYVKDGELSLQRRSRGLDPPAAVSANCTTNHVFKMMNFALIPAVLQRAD